MDKLKADKNLVPISNCAFCLTSHSQLKTMPLYTIYEIGV